MRIHCLQHVAFESPGTILSWAGQKGHTITYTNFFEPAFLLPSLQDFDMLLIMGGYMNVDEEESFPWLKKEKQWINEAITNGKKVIGICLGAQLIASALGCKVYKGKEKEIGFFPVQFSDEAKSLAYFSHFTNPYTLFHWHGDTFDLPAGAVLVASTDVCRHQAFLIGEQVLGLQFHLEMNEETVELMMANDGNELLEGGNHIQSSVEIRGGYTFLKRNREDIFVLLNKFINSSPSPFSMG
jgi:GMP synthase-like glutamine amidotransferase